MTPRIERATAEDAAAVEAFMLTVPEFAGTIVPGGERVDWAWLFTSGEAGGAFVAREEPDDRVVGHWGVAPFRLRHDDRVLTAGFFAKLAIDPAYRQTPLFMSLATKLLKAIGRPEFGIEATYTLANRPGILEFLLAFGGVTLGEVPVLAKPFRPDRVIRSLLPPHLGRVLAAPLALAAGAYRLGLRLASGARSGARSGGPRGLAVREVDLAGPGAEAELAALGGADGLDRLLRHARLTAVRSAETLRRRFLEGPGRTRGYRLLRVDGPDGLAGYAVLRRMRMQTFDALAVVDLVVDRARPDATRALLRHVDRLALGMGVDVVSVFANDPTLRRALRRSLYLATPERFTLVVSRGGGSDLAASSLDDWYLTWFDHDYV